MDEIVLRAMVKWPNVPDCYGWLALDARGNWRMRDEPAQRADLAGDKIEHTALCGFINRNYASDDSGRWYFQNGPQRVYVNLQATPYIARTDPIDGLVLHTGAVMEPVDRVWLTSGGSVVFQSADRIAQLDDRDTAQCLAMIYQDDAVASDSALLEWLDSAGGCASLRMVLRTRSLVRSVPIEWRDHATLMRASGFVQLPQPD